MLIITDVETLYRIPDNELKKLTVKDRIVIFSRNGAQMPMSKFQALASIKAKMEIIFFMCISLPISSLCYVQQLSCRPVFHFSVSVLQKPYISGVLSGFAVLRRLLPCTAGIAFSTFVLILYHIISYILITF